LPIVLHEQNAVPGAANRFLARWARVVAVSFDESAARFKANTVHTGNPVRRQVAAVPSGREELRREALDVLGLKPDRRTLIVFGGSQGAAHINDVAVEMCRILGDRSDLQVVLLTGEAHIDAVGRQLPRGDLHVQAMGFLDRMELAYAVADLAVARAGATSIAELTMCGIPSLLIPYPHATANHQEANARALERVGGAEVILDAQLSSEVLAVHVQRLFGEPGVLNEMSASSRGFGKRGAASELADLVEGAA